MTKPLRQRHLIFWLILGPAAAVLFVAAVSQRPDAVATPDPTTPVAPTTPAATDPEPKP
ncbi:MAG: hypothetical protein AAF288_13150 [Planctomycetota bacterium]